MKDELRFRMDGTFKIVQFTDVHWRKNNENDRRSRELMDIILKEEAPDLVVFTGDTIDSTYCPDAFASFKEAVQAPEQREIPWAIVFGNHDTEIGATREQLIGLAESHPYCLAAPGPRVISGEGNYVLSVRSSEEKETIAAHLYFLDSGDYAPKEFGGYSWIQPDQIDWYLHASTDGIAVEKLPPALAFFHIPFPEYDEVWRTAVCRGTKREKVCSAKINSGLFAALLKKGDVMATFVGHDHLNDYSGTLHGINLVYGRQTGYNEYGFENRGARVIRLREGIRSYETWVRLDTGERISEPPEHPPELPEAPLHESDLPGG